MSGTRITRIYIGNAIRAVGAMALLSETDEDFVHMAAWESFGVNVRLLAEFLVRPTSRSDYGGGDYEGWTGNSRPQDLPHADAATALKDIWWDLVSKEIMHLSLIRDPRREGGLSSAPEGWIGLAAADTLQVVADFVDVLSAAGHPDADTYGKNLQASLNDLESWREVRRQEADAD